MNIRWLEWGGSVLSMIGTTFIAHHSVTGWWLCTVADILLVVVSLKAKLYGFLFLCGGYAIVNIIGGVSWSLGR